MTNERRSPPRPRHGKRTRCSDPHELGCSGWARRNTKPPTCADCGAGTRAQAKYTSDGTRIELGKVSVSPRVQALLNGELDVSDLDNEELVRGYTRSADGTFRGRVPKVIPKAIHDRMVAELFQRSDAILRDSLIDAVETMRAVMTSPHADEGQRIKAAIWIFERLRGKTPDMLQIDMAKPYVELLDELHRGEPKALPPAQIIDAEIVEDERF
jgi:hypothetical protein